MSRSQGDSEEEALRALELAEGYLEDAENVLWTTASDIDTGDVSNQLQGLTEQLWEIQQQVYELQEQINDES